MAAMTARGLTLATAESCTGGMLGQTLTAMAGSSAFYRGGVISYTNEVKMRLLGVDGQLLETHGAVSEPVARAMAEGVRRAVGADLGVGITGIAGPDGDGTGKPVGLIYVAVSGEAGTVCRELRLHGDRRGNREAACAVAITMILEQL